MNNLERIRAVVGAWLEEDRKATPTAFALHDLLLESGCPLLAEQVFADSHGFSREVGWLRLLLEREPADVEAQLKRQWYPRLKD